MLVGSKGGLWGPRGSVILGVAIGDLGGGEGGGHYYYQGWWGAQCYLC
jgi:hypothetical protein